MRDLIGRGIVPSDGLSRSSLTKGEEGYAMGQVAAVIRDVPPAKMIVEGMVAQAVKVLRDGNMMVQPKL